MTGEAFRTRLFAVMEEFLLLLARQKPVVMVLEDLHWADLTSMDLIAHLLLVTTQAPVAVMLCGRPEQGSAGNWERLAPVLASLRDPCVELQLQPLSEPSNRDLVRGLLKGSALPEKFMATITYKAGGNPFFVEEVLRSLIERGVLVREEAGWEVTELVETIQVPDTLQAVLLSRLDRLPDETRRVIQKAAVIGRLFLYRVLRHMASDERGLNDQISLLLDAELVRERARHPEIEYIFRHALTQEVAYQTLLAPARKALHQKVGAAMEAVFAERIDEHTNLVAYHYFQGEAWDKALEYSTRAADAAVHLYAYAEARGHYQRALDALKQLPDVHAHRQKRVDLTVRLVNVSLQAESPEKNMALLMEAEAVAQSLGDPARLARVQLWIGRAHYLAGRLREAIGYFQEVLAAAPQLGDAELMALPGAVIGRVLCIQGRFTQGIQLLNQAAPLLEAAKNWHELLFANLYLSVAHSCVGDYTAGIAMAGNVLETAKASRNQNAETMAHTAIAIVQLTAGRYAEAIDSAREALAIAEQSGDAMFRYSSNSFIAWGLTGLGDHLRALKHWSAAHEAAKPLGGRLLLGEWLAAIESESLLASGDTEAALKQGEEALAISKAAESVIAEGLAERAIGRALAAGPPPKCDEAEVHFARSVSLLEGIGAKYELARALLAQGQCRLAGANRDLAAEPLRRAAELAAECGIQREENAARSMLASLPPLS